MYAMERKKNPKDRKEKKRSKRTTSPVDFKSMGIIARKKNVNDAAMSGIMRNARF